MSHGCHGFHGLMKCSISLRLPFRRRPFPYSQAAQQAVADIVFRQLEDDKSKVDAWRLSVNPTVGR